MPQTYGIAYNDSLPGTGADGSQKQVLVDRYGISVMRDAPLLWAEQGSYFRALNNATPGTGVAQAITTAFSATAVPLVLVNGSATKRIIPHYIRLVNTAAGSTTTSSHFAISIDSANRYSSGGTDISGLIYCANSALGPTTSVSVLRVGTVTASAAGGGTRYVSYGVLKTQAAPCWVVGDEVIITFGDPTGAGSMGLLSGAAAGAIVKAVGPVVLGGQDDSLILHLWNPANATTAPSWAFEVAWWER
jgi:hypothetical protein